VSVFKKIKVKVTSSASVRRGVPGSRLRIGARAESEPKASNIPQGIPVAGSRRRLGGLRDLALFGVGENGG
jgi:hypothetical protein